MEPFQAVEKNVLHLPEWEALDRSLIAGFTTRDGGISEKSHHALNTGLHVADEDSNVIANRSQIADALQIPLDSWVMGEQVHGTTIHIVDTDDRGKGSRDQQTALPATDGLITKEKGILNAAFFADCVPLLFFDPPTGYIGIAHAGWRGSVHDMAGEMVNVFHELGVETSELLAAIGPCISKDHYEVDGRIIGQMEPSMEQIVATKKAPDAYLLDLKRLNREMLIRAGIPADHIAMSDYCTYRDGELFFSHRRDNGKTGRMLGFIGYRVDG